MFKLLKYMKGYKKESVCAPLFKLLEASFELLVPLVMARIIDIGIKNQDRGYIVRMCLVMAALGLIGLVCSITAQYFSAKAAVGFATKLRHEVFAHVQSLSFSEMDEIGTSTLITRMTSDINQVQSGVNLFLRLFMRSPFIVFGAMVMAFTIDVKAALIFVVVIPLLCVIVFGIMLISIPLYRRVQERLDKVVGVTRENLQGVRVIRAFCREQQEIGTFDENNELLVKVQLFSGRISALMNPLTYVVVNGGLLVLLYVGAKQVDSGILLQGSVVALVNYMSQILTELVKLANLIIQVTKAIACGNRIQTVMETPAGMDGECAGAERESGRAVEHVATERRDGQVMGNSGTERDSSCAAEKAGTAWKGGCAAEKAGTERKDGYTAGNTGTEWKDGYAARNTGTEQKEDALGYDGDRKSENAADKDGQATSEAGRNHGSTAPDQDMAVEFDHVRFRYKGAGADALSGIHFSVCRGETVGIIGGTGSGKSSLVSLIPRFYDVYEGSVRVNGVDVRDYPVEEIRGKVGIVMQKAVLFKGTIRENLLWGNEQASDEDMKEAIRAAQAEDVVFGAKNGLDTYVEQEGRNFSGGQKQRLTIARALVRRPEILILDDSASALDFATDAKLRRAIAELSGKMTVFIVSQRTSSIQHADKIIVLDDGEIVRMGTHEELLAGCGVYQETHYSQFPKEEESA